MDKIHFNDKGELVIPYDLEHEALAALETNFEAYIKACPPGETKNMEALSKALEAIHLTNRAISYALSGAPNK